GNLHDHVIWQRPRLVAPGRPDLLLRDVRSLVRSQRERRRVMLPLTEQYLAAADEFERMPQSSDVSALAGRHTIDVPGLVAWLTYLGLQPTKPVKVEGHFSAKLQKVGGYDFVSGWGTNDTPLLVANSSGQH